MARSDHGLGQPCIGAPGATPHETSTAVNLQMHKSASGADCARNPRCYLKIDRTNTQQNSILSGVVHYTGNPWFGSQKNAEREQTLLLHLRIFRIRTVAFSAGLFDRPLSRCDHALHISTHPFRRPHLRFHLVPVERLRVLGPAQ